SRALATNGRLMGRRSRRALVPALVVLALVAVVVVAATGSIPGGTSDTRRPPDVLYDTILSLMAVAMIPAAAILVWGLAQRREVSAEYTRIRRRNHILALLLLLVPVAFYLHGFPRPRAPNLEFGLARGQPATPTTPTTPPDAKQ